MPNLGVHVSRKATAVSTPAVAAVSIPFVVGLAPVHTAARPAKANVPVLCTGWDEAVEQLGFSYDWKTYPLCEFMYSHFKLYQCQPVIFCNVLDPASAKEALAETEYQVTGRQALLPFGTLADDSLSVSAGETELVRDTDYSIFYDAEKGACIVELLSSGSAYEAAALTVSGSTVKPGSVTTADIVEGLDQADACMTRVGVIPDLICAPGFSHQSAVAAVMAVKAAGVNGLFGGKALIDADCGAEGVQSYSELPAYKAAHNIVDENQILCWPLGTLGDYTFHMSTQLAGLMAQVDADNGGCPYESPSNKKLQIDGCCLEDGTEVNLTWEQVNLVAGSWGVVTAINFMTQGWTAKGNYTACYPGNTDVKDQFIPVSRMFDWVGNTLIRTFWSKLDQPMRRRLLDTIQDTCNIWLNGLVSQEYLLGGRVEIIGAENPLTGLLEGVIAFHIYLTPPGPAQEIKFTLEYDVDYLTAALAPAE